MFCRTKKRSQNSSTGLADFQKQVYSLIKKISKGRISTYGQIARVLGRPNSARLIGRILSKNPHLIKIPCHRVVKSDGQIGGYKLGIRKKAQLLKKEGIKIQRDKILNFNQIIFKF